MDLTGTIWDEHVFGLTFDGKIFNADGDGFCVGPNTPLILIGEADNLLGDIHDAETFLKSYGFQIYDIHNIQEESDVTVEAYLLSLPCLHESVVILTKDRLWRRFGPILKKHNIRSQLFSRVQWLYNWFRPNLRKAYQLLEDDYSKEVFTISVSVHYKILPEKAIWPYYDPNQYFSPPEMFAYDGEEVFVDCGAFVGDTVENFIRCRGNYFKKIYAFEPGIKQYNALLERVNRLRKEWALEPSQIECVACGVGARSENLGIANGEWYGDMGATRLVEADKEENLVEVVDLDTYLKKESKISFIKADIEGFEMEMLKGASQIIKRDMPKLAITLYHKLTDYYEVPLYIKSLVPEYKFKVLHHHYKYPETVLYAYI